MTELPEWIQPLWPGQIAFGELAGKALARVRYCPKGEYGDFFEEGHFFEFQFTDGSIFRIDSRKGFQVQYMRTDGDGDLLGEVTSYGVLGDG
jgi:hypothetical protein